MSKYLSKQSKLDPIPEHIFGTQRSILKASLSCFVDRGYGGFTYAEVSKEAGISRQRIIYHYATPDDILIELAAIWNDRGRMITLESLARLKTLEISDKIVAMADAIFTFTESYPELAKLTGVLFNASRYNPKIKTVVEQGMDMGRQRISDFLEGEIKNKKLLQEKTKAIHGMLWSAGLFLSFDNFWSDAEIYKKSIEFSIRQLLKG